MNYPLDIYLICKKIIKESSFFNIRNHTLAKEIKETVYDVTNHFPEKIVYTDRIRAIANDSTCECSNCKKVHGRYNKIYCSEACHQYERSQTRKIQN